MKIISQNIGIIGMGYVGLPLAVEFSKKLNVVGFDINKDRIKQLKDKIDITNELESNELKNLDKINFSYDIDSLKKCNIYIITVPTPVNLDNKPDLNPLIKATKLVSKILKKNDTVIYESTVYPGATEEICGPILEKNSRLKINKNLFLG